MMKRNGITPKAPEPTPNDDTPPFPRETSHGSPYSEGSHWGVHWGQESLGERGFTSFINLILLYEAEKTKRPPKNWASTSWLELLFSWCVRDILCTERQRSEAQERTSNLVLERRGVSHSWLWRGLVRPQNANSRAPLVKLN